MRVLKISVKVHAPILRRWRFELGEHHLNRVEETRASTQPHAWLLLLRCSCAWRDCRGSGQCSAPLQGQHLLDASGESFAIHCALDDPECDQGLGAKTSNKGLRSLQSKRGVHDQSFPALRPAPPAGPKQARYEPPLLRSKMEMLWRQTCPANPLLLHYSFCSCRNASPAR